MKIIFFNLVLFLMAISCGQKDSFELDSLGNVSISPSIVLDKNIESTLEERINHIPDMCTLVSLTDISSSLSIASNDIRSRNSDQLTSSVSNRSCFFKWDDSNYPNSGILMQVKTQSPSSDFDNWAILFMDNIRAQGAQKMGDPTKYGYKIITGMSDEGLFNTDVGEYYWRFSDKVILHLAFNSRHEQEEQMKLAIDLGSTMIENFLE